MISFVKKLYNGQPDHKNDITDDNDVEKNHDSGMNGCNMDGMIKKNIDNKDHVNQPSVNALCVKLFMNNISFGLAFNLVFSMLISSIAIPFLFTKYNRNLLDHENNDHIFNATKMVLMIIGLNIVLTMHRNQFVEHHKRLFINSMHADMESFINDWILCINWNVLRKLNDNDLDRKKTCAKWSILYLITFSINTVINLFSFFGFMIWIGFISPVSLMLYIVGIFSIIVYFPHNEKEDKTKYHDLWDKYYNLQCNSFTNIIHFRGYETLQKMRKCIVKIEHFFICSLVITKKKFIKTVI